MDEKQPLVYENAPQTHLNKTSVSWMKYGLLALAVIVLIFSAIYWYSNRIDLQAYHSEEGDFRIAVPDSWEFNVEDGSSENIVTPAQYAGKVSFSDNNQDGLLGSLFTSQGLIRVERHDRESFPITEQGFYDYVDRQLESSTYQTFITAKEPENITVNGNAAYLVEMHWEGNRSEENDDDTSYKGYMVFIYVDETSQYVINITGPESDKLHNYSEEIYRSFIAL